MNKIIEIARKAFYVTTLLAFAVFAFWLGYSMYNGEIFVRYNALLKENRDLQLRLDECRESNK